MIDSRSGNLLYRTPPPVEALGKVAILPKSALYGDERELVDAALLTAVSRRTETVDPGRQGAVLHRLAVPRGSVLLPESNGDFPN